MTPLTPPDCDLRGYEFMPLYGHHLFGSDFNARVSDPGWRAAVTLWWAAWNQVPAASLPNDDVALTRLADLGRDLKVFRKIKAEALGGFILCDDGRLYHKALAVWALEAWARRVKERVRKASWRAGQRPNETTAGAGQRRDSVALSASQEPSTDVVSPSPEPSTDEKKTGPPMGQTVGQRRDVPAEVKVREFKTEGLEGCTVPSVNCQENVNGHDNGTPLTPIFETKQSEKQGKTFDLPQQMLKMPPGWRTDDRATDQAGRLLGLQPGTFESYAEFRRRISEKFEAYRLEFLGIRPAISDVENGAGKYAE